VGQLGISGHPVDVPAIRIHDLGTHDSLLVLPQQIDGPEFNMDEHFFQIRRPLFIAFALATLVVMVDGDVLGKEPILHPGRIGNLVMLALAFWGYVSASRKTHNFIASLILLVFFGLIAFRFWSPR
jgi:hypothetical protein